MPAPLVPVLHEGFGVAMTLTPKSIQEVFTKSIGSSGQAILAEANIEWPRRSRKAHAAHGLHSLGWIKQILGHFESQVPRICIYAGGARCPPSNVRFFCIPIRAGLLR